MTFKKRNNSTHTFCMIAVFAVFAILAVLLTLTGARVYREITASMSANNALRSSLSYVANKVRSITDQQTLLVIEQDEQPVIVIKEQADGETYLTRIFFDGEYLKEFASIGAETDTFSFDSGDKIAKLHRFTVAQKDGLLTLTATAENLRTLSLTIKTDP